MANIIEAKQGDVVRIVATNGNRISTTGDCWLEYRAGFFLAVDVLGCKPTREAIGEALFTLKHRGGAAG